MTVEHIDPNEIDISDLNERRSNVDISDLKDSIEDEGIIEGLEPVVRPTDGGGYEAFIGQRRIMAAREVGLEEIPVNVSDKDDQSALKASIVENAALFKQSVSSSDRAQALDRLWGLMDGDGFPSATALSDELNVPESTIRTWLEPLREEWEDTDVDPTPSDDSESDESVDEAVDADADVAETDVDSGDESPDGSVDGPDGEDVEAADVEDVEDEEPMDDDLVEATKDRQPDGPDAEFQNVDTAENHGVSESDDGTIDVPDIKEKIEPGSEDDTDDTASEEEDDRDESEDTESVDDDGEGVEGDQMNIVDELGEGKLQKIRTMTGGGETGEEMAKRVAEAGLTKKQLNKVKKLHERGNDLDEAFEKVTGEQDDGEQLRTEVVLTGDTADRVESLADDRETTEDDIISEAVEYYLEHHSAAGDE